MKTMRTSSASSRAILHGFCHFLGFAQLLLGCFGFLGTYEYIIDSPENLSRYQYLLLPMYMFVFAIPLLVLAAFIYRRCRSDMSRPGRFVFNLGCALPVASVIAAFFAPVLIR